MTLYASLGDIPVVHGMLTIPLSGIWMADVVLIDPTDVTGPQVLQIADQKFKCTPVRAISFAGARGVRLVGGAAGWRTEIPAKFYSPNTTVKIVLDDAAAAVGEEIDATDTTVLPNYVRRKGEAASVLNDRLGSTWWMDFDGVVQTVPRIGTPIGSDYVAEMVIGAAGIWRIATETVSDWVPARTFLGPTSSGTISLVEHRLGKGQLRTLVHTSP